LGAAPLDGIRTPASSVDGARGNSPAQQAVGDNLVKIVSVDTAQGNVGVRSLTGEVVYFRIPPGTIKAHGLSVGQMISFRGIRGIAGSGGVEHCPCGKHLDGSCVCGCVPECENFCMVGECRDGVQGPVGGGGLTTQPSGTGGSLAAPLDGAKVPAATVASIDTAAGLATGKVKATGQQFQFKLNNVAALSALQIGQPLYVNLTNRQVSLDGQHAAGQIVSIGSSGAAPLDGNVSRVAPVDGIQSQSAPVDGATAAAAPTEGIAASGAARSRFRFSPTQGGYVFQNLPPRFLALLQDGEKLQITVDNPRSGKGTITGVVSRTTGGFRMMTPDRLSVSAANSWLLVRGGRPGGGGGGSRCGGCPRDPAMKIYEDETICYCMVSEAPSGGVHQGALETTTSFCGGSPVK